jgi:hypothetical protein
MGQAFAQSTTAEENGQLATRIWQLESALDSALARITNLEQLAGGGNGWRIIDADGRLVGKQVLSVDKRYSERWGGNNEELQAIVLFDTVPNVVLNVDTNGLMVETRRVGAEFEPNPSIRETLIVFSEPDCQGESTPLLRAFYEDLIGAPTFVFSRVNPSTGELVWDDANNSNIWYIAAGDEIPWVSQHSVDREGQVVKECMNYSGDPFMVKKIWLESVPNLNFLEYKRPLRLITD